MSGMSPTGWAHLVVNFFQTYLKHRSETDNMVNDKRVLIQKAKFYKINKKNFINLVLLLILTNVQNSFKHHISDLFMTANNGKTTLYFCLRRISKIKR